VDRVAAHEISYVAELGAQREAFGWQLYAEVMRRGGTERELVVVADGAAWIWSLVDLHFPHATCILDWFHATEYVWAASAVLKAATGEQQQAWAEEQLGRMWAGKVDEVITVLEAHAADGEAMGEAARYFRNQQERMAYPVYRARGFPVGSGTMESGCKQVVSGRLKGAGMRWGAMGAREVVKVRAWLKGERWADAMELRAVPQRRRRSAGPRAMQDGAGEQGAVVVDRAPQERACSGHVAEAVAQVRAELHHKPSHPWKRAWSHKQQRVSSA
jgi:hypothetical protein